MELLRPSFIKDNTRFAAKIPFNARAATKKGAAEAAPLSVKSAV
jgi:hypothetical protein